MISFKCNIQICNINNQYQDKIGIIMNNNNNISMSMMEMNSNPINSNNIKECSNSGSSSTTQQNQKSGFNNIDAQTMKLTSDTLKVNVKLNQQLPAKYNFSYSSGIQKNFAKRICLSS